MAHQKHPTLARPQLGQFARQEWAILGAPCSVIAEMSEQWLAALGSELKLAYVDAEHQTTALPTALQAGAQLQYRDKIDYQELQLRRESNAYDWRQWFLEQDAVLVNGNHFKAHQQLVILDPRKEASLARKVEQLTSLQAILTTPEQREPYPFLPTTCADGSPIPLLAADQPAAVAYWLRQQILAQRPPLYGLVLTGGFSQRMGQDKGWINYHGRPQWAHLVELLGAHCAQVYVSCRPDQVAQFPTGVATLPDSFIQLGPFGAILSAFRANPDAAWLVLACDLPFFDAAALTELVESRQTGQYATCFRSPFDQFPEPLATIWEPRSYARLLQFLAQGHGCPRKVLINSPIALIEPRRPGVLANVNTPDEKAAAAAKL